MGDKNGRAGIGIGKANDVSAAIKKAVSTAKKKLTSIDFNENKSIKREVTSIFNGAKILMRPAPEGTSIISGGVVRSVAELSGIKNLVAKSFGSNNKINLAKAALNGLLEATKNE
ncbi:MAG: 30S ribosomal protein S5 [candidate division WS2 bacterium ADurb.Bin280]|uniref:Small ribosomal subunit protein uS5 n=1 Tax=candidate division WS2 bacterium ADurb.Bin280 TaxID=1852829 RepID=A0A1V5SBZ4_9BACT|nr:MAG: 30S ribosomal protein S5 [candidate division WS2 bacterium ADurb.Bin280]